MRIGDTGRIDLFQSYAHEDERYRQRMAACLSGLRDEGIINDWHDRLIVPSEDWHHTIDERLELSEVVVLLVSPAFMTSEYCRGVEVKRAIELHRKRRCRIVPVIIEPTDWMQSEFGSFQALPKDARPVSEWSDPDEAWADVAAGIRRVCESIVDWQNPYRRANVGDWVELKQTMLDETTGATVETHLVMTVTKKAGNTLTVEADGVANGMLQKPSPRVQIALDQPLEDDLDVKLAQLKTEFPRDAEFRSDETGHGEQVVNIGGKSHYTQWTGREARIQRGHDVYVLRSCTWRSIKVPLDGIVKSEMQAPGVEWNQILLDFGWEEPKEARRRRKSLRRSASGVVGADRTGPCPPGQVAALQARGTTALVLGILSLFFFPPLGLFAMGTAAGVNRGLRSCGAPTSGPATAGFALGLIGTILTVVAVIAILAVLAGMS